MNVLSHHRAASALLPLSEAFDTIFCAVSAARNLADDKLVLDAISEMGHAQDAILRAAGLLHEWSEPCPIPSGDGRDGQ